MDILQILFTLLTTLGTSAISYLVYRLQKREARLESLTAEMEEKRKIRDRGIDKALRALCRDRVLQGFRYYSRQGYVSAQDLETINKLYEAYHDLGGNGTITNVYDKIVLLPLKEG